jgi:hypothetical protein
VFLAWYQIKKTSDLHRIQFEDSLAKEYRDLVQQIPIKALMGEELSSKEFEDAKPYLFHYINLTNDQIFLRSKGRVGEKTWIDWQGGIESNMKLPAFRKIWNEVKEKTNSFDELRKLEKDEYSSDPESWIEEKKAKELESGN